MCNQPDFRIEELIDLYNKNTYGDKASVQTKDKSVYYVLNVSLYTRHGGYRGGFWTTDDKDFYYKDISGETDYYSIGLKILYDNIGENQEIYRAVCLYDMTNDKNVVLYYTIPVLDNIRAYNFKRKQQVEVIDKGSMSPRLYNDMLYDLKKEYPECTLKEKDTEPVRQNTYKETRKKYIVHYYPRWDKNHEDNQHEWVYANSKAEA